MPRLPGDPPETRGRLRTKGDGGVVAGVEGVGAAAGAAGAAGAVGATDGVSVIGAGAAFFGLGAMASPGGEQMGWAV